MVDKIILKLLISDRGLLLNYMDQLKGLDFPSPGNIIFNTMVDIVTNGGDVSLAVLNHKLPQMKVFLGEVMNTETDSETIGNLLPILKEGTVRRNCRSLATGILQRVEKEKPNELVDYITEQSLNLVDNSTGQAESLYEIVDRMIDLDNLKPKTSLGYDTGLPSIDSMLLGMEDASFNVLAGNSSTGKSEMSRQILGHNLDLGKPVMVFSLEESTEEYAQKYLCFKTGIPHFKIRTERLSSGEVRRLKQEKERLLKQPVKILTGNITIPMMHKNIRHYQFKEGKNPLVILDHIHIFGEQSVEGLTTLTRNLKLMVASLKVPLLALAQTNRENYHREDQVPIMSDLRGSGSIEQDSSRVFFLTSTNDESPERPTTFWIAKQRNGISGSVKLINKRYLQRFVEV